MGCHISPHTALNYILPNATDTEQCWAATARSSHVPPGEPAYAEFVIARRTMGASTATWTPVPVQIPHQKGDQLHFDLNNIKIFLGDEVIYDIKKLKI